MGPYAVLSNGRQTGKRAVLSKYDKHGTVGIMEEPNSSWETREGFLEEVTPEPQLRVPLAI